MTQPRKSYIFSKDNRRKDRRKKIDPRYRNASYPDFVDRRSGKDRRCQGECEQTPNISQYLREKRGVMILGVVAGAIFLYLFALCAYNVLDLPSFTERQPRKSNPIVNF